MGVPHAVQNGRRICRKCLTMLSVDDFYPRGGDRPGTSSWCKQCCSQYSSERQKQLLEEDPEGVREAGRLRMEAHRRRNGVKPRVPAGPTKVCPGCKVEKDRESDFYQTLRHGKAVSVGYCKVCASERQKTRDWSKRLVEQTKARHIKRWDSEFDLTPEFLRTLFERQGGRCAWLRVELRATLGGSFRHPNQISLDRIDNRLGYTQANVMLVCQAANLARCDSPIEVFEDFVREVRRAP